MARRTLYIVAIGITLMLLVTLAVPAIAEPTERKKETTPESSANTYIPKPEGGQEKVTTGPQMAWIKYGPITQSSVAKYYYVSYGGKLGGKPVVVTGLAIPYKSPYWANQKFSINTESNYLYNNGVYVHVVSHDGKSLTGSYINLIGMY